MNGLRIFGIFLLVLGILFLAFGFITKLMHWKDVLEGMLLGPFIIFVGAMMLTLNYIRSKK